MMTDGGDNLQLYKAVNFPTEWVKHSDLHDNSYINPTVVFFKDVWWMFANVQQNHHIHLHVLWASSPLGPWESHPNNCVVETYNAEGEPVSHKCAGGAHVQKHHKTGPLLKGQIGIRSGGRAFVYKDKLYRMVQHSKEVQGM